LREGDERFVETVARVGLAPFKERVYRDHAHAHERVAPPGDEALPERARVAA
jgi:hypothetical protein